MLPYYTVQYRDTSRHPRKYSKNHTHQYVVRGTCTTLSPLLLRTSFGDVVFPSSSSSALRSSRISSSLFSFPSYIKF